MRIYALVTFDLAAWLPTPCAGWSYYHTLLMATLLPLYLVLVVALVSLCSRDPDAKQRACRRLAVLLLHLPQVRLEPLRLFAHGLRALTTVWSPLSVDSGSFPK